MEDVENFRNRPPSDIDIVTFFYIPDGHTERSLYKAFPSIFNLDITKFMFCMDAHRVPLDQDDLEMLIRRSAYWYGVCSHRSGDLLWKGFVQIDLDDSEDERARAALNRLSGEREANS